MLYSLLGGNDCICCSPGSPNFAFFRRVHRRPNRTPEGLGELDGIRQRTQHSDSARAVHVGQQVVQQRLFGGRFTPDLQNV